MRDLRANGVGKTVAENLSKVLAAFAAGLAIFAGCALIYSRVQDSQAPAAASSRVHPVPASSTTPAVSTENADPEASSVPAGTEQAPAPATDPQAPVRTHRTTSHLDPSAPVSPPMRMKPQIPDAVLHPWMSASAAPHGAPVPPVQLPELKTISVPPGTILKVRLNETLSSKHNSTGQTFRATLAFPLIVDGTVVAKSGATVLGRVVDARKARLIHGRSDLSLILTDLTTSDRQLVKVRTAQWYERGSGSEVVRTAKAATGAAVGAVKGAAVGAARGAGLRSGGDKDEDAATDPSGKHVSNKKNIVLPAGTQLEFRLISPFSVTTP
ncbi:MAG TPA: hypothetical protein VFB14_15865 [Bryobacteraceae bacterium]|nr:hypothetical protein [Bryobacteraceae bacterium]